VYVRSPSFITSPAASYTYPPLVIRFVVGSIVSKLGGACALRNRLRLPIPKSIKPEDAASAGCANWPSTTVFPAVSDGYWVKVEALPPGNHVINFGGISNNGFSVNVTYHITVTP
jgi:hypothetical protein